MCWRIPTGERDHLGSGRYRYPLRFDGLHIETLAVSRFPFNLQSIEKAGFHYLKSAVGSWKRCDGVEMDEEVYTMSRDDYRRLYN